MKLANITLVRDKQSPIFENTYIETVPFWKITWAPQHVIFHVNEDDENDLVVYSADRIYELVTEDLEK